MLYLHPAPVKGIITSMQLKLKFFCFKYILVANPKAIIGSAYAYKFSTYASTQNNLLQNLLTHAMKAMLAEIWLELVSSLAYFCFYSFNLLDHFVKLVLAPQRQLSSAS